VIHALAIIYPLREAPFVKQFQVVQETLDKVVLRIVPETKLTSTQRQGLIQRAQGALGADIQIGVESVDEIPPLASGKYRYVISNVADRYVKELSGRRAVSARVDWQVS
jgi:phenylacetate-CoA ligase